MVSVLIGRGEMVVGDPFLFLLPRSSVPDRLQSASAPPFARSLPQNL